MPDLRPTLHCPACLGVPLLPLTFAGGGVCVDQCRRCGGLWVEKGEVQALRGVKPTEFWNRATSPGAPVMMRCHDCHGLMDRSEAACAGCGWSNVLPCPSCENPMRVEKHAGILVDICGGCEGAWFDHHEVEAIWSAAFQRTRATPPVRHSAATPTEMAATTAGDILLFAPDLVYFGVKGTVEGAAELSRGVTAVPEAAGGAVELVSEAAGGVFEAVASIVGGIFDIF